MTQRLAVLELQGEVGSFARRQAWTDAMRATALKLLHERGVQVIDRDQFTELVSPGRDLSDCVGMCAAELAREVGAQWSLSGHLVTTPAQVILITLKLHDASGQLLGIEQREITLSQLNRDQLSELARVVIKRTLIPQLDLRARRASSRRDVLNSSSDRNSRVYTRTYMRDRERSSQGRSEVQETQETQEAQETQRDQPQAKPRWTELTTTRGEQLCVSPLITRAQYQECVHAGVCEATKVWGQCAVNPDDAVRCVNMQQALRYARWRGGWILSERDWRVWMSVNRDESRSHYFEWVIPAHDSALLEASWRAKVISMSVSALRRAQPIRALRARSRPQGAEERRAPLAFAVSDLSFRVAYERPKCPGR